MKNKIEFRIPEEFAIKFLMPNVGICLGGSVRKLIIDMEDPLFEKIKEYENKMKKRGLFFFQYWKIKRIYTKKELMEAELLQVIFTSFFEQGGEEYGTIYDESIACPLCGANRQQISELYLDLTKIPKNKDISRSLAGELVVSERFVQIINDNKFSGVQFIPVKHCRKNYRSSRQYYQMKIISLPISIDQRTQCGNDPFDLDINNEYRCPEGHVCGYSLISELFVNRNTWNGDDFIITKEKIGVKKGLFRPSPKLLITNRVWEILEKEKIKGIRFEIAHLV